MKELQNSKEGLSRENKKTLHL